jgi:CRISPR/Cas system-associated exonuclease Cas4 (RecB family)
MQISMLLFDKQLAYLGPKHRSDAQYGFEHEDGTRYGVVIKRDEALLQEIFQTLAMIQRHVRSGTPLPKSSRELKGSGSCKNCEFYHLCHGADERAKAGLEPVVLYPGPQIEEHPDQPISGEARE